MSQHNNSYIIASIQLYLWVSANHNFLYNTLDHLRTQRGLAVRGGDQGHSPPLITLISQWSCLSLHMINPRAPPSIPTSLNETPPSLSS